MNNTQKLQKGDDIFIHFEEENNPNCYAYCEYKGRRNGKHIFVSNTYGWKYTVDTINNTVINEYNPDKVMKLNNDSGWLKYLP